MLSLQGSGRCRGLGSIPGPGVSTYLRSSQKKRAVPAVVPWAKNLTAAAPVAVEARVRPPTWPSGLKDLVLPQLWCGFDPWPGNLHMSSPFKKKKRVCAFGVLPKNA